MKPKESHEIKPDGWHDETILRDQSVFSFIQKLVNSTSDRLKYDPMTEFHLSGHNMFVMNKISEGTANIIKVEVLYENGEPVQIHVVFDGEGRGHNIDYYLQGRAINDYLSS